MALSTFTELKTSVGTFLNREDLVAVIPDFIALAEADMQRKVRHWRQEATTSIALSGQYTALPADFLEVIRFYVTDTDTKPLELISQAQLIDRKRQAANTGGSPSYYAITAGQIEVFPVPDATYNAELYYYTRLDALGDATATNWLLDYHKDAYLYGALMHSSMYLQEDARLAGWGALYQQAIDSINSDGEKAKFGGSGLRMKIRSY